MKSISVSFILFVVSIIWCSPIYGQSDIALVSEKSPLYTEVMSVAIKWKEAVLKKDFNMMLSFALPEYKSSVEKMLKDKKSNIYIYLYGQKKSVYQLFRHAKKIKIALLQDERLGNYGSGVIVCYYNESKIQPKSLAEFVALRNLMLKDIDKSYCEFFFKSEGQWYVDYE